MSSRLWILADSLSTATPPRIQTLCGICLYDIRCPASICHDGRIVRHYPLLHRPRQFTQGSTKLCKLVFDARWYFRIADTLNKTVPFEVAQGLCEHLLRYAPNRAHQRARSNRSLGNRKAIEQSQRDKDKSCGRQFESSSANTARLTTGASKRSRRR